MDKFTTYLSLEKSSSLIGSPSSKILETSPDGLTRTKYRLKGVASSSALDRDNEIVSKECVHKMAEKIKLRKLPIFGNHEHGWDNMLGAAVDAEEINGNLIMTIETAYEETHPAIKQLAGALDAGLPLMLSIGGKVNPGTSTKSSINGKNVNIINDVDLLETSVVGIGANPEAFITLDRVTKIFKGDETMDTLKSAGQAGEASYGKLGETTVQARCPSCSKPAELRSQSGGGSVYHCNDCGAHFTVDAFTRNTSQEPTNNVPSPNTPKLDEVPKLAIEQKNYKGDIMVDEIVSKSAPIAAKACEEDDEEKEYKKFKARYSKMLAEKAEGTTGTPGSENAAPKNTINAKSAKEYESMAKAFTENAGIEGTSVATAEPEAFSFKAMRMEQIGRK